jgi:hypothetical protein
VKVSSAVVAMPIVPHDHSIAPPRPRGGDVGHALNRNENTARSNPAGSHFSKTARSGAPQSCLATVPQQTRSYLRTDVAHPPSNEMQMTRPVVALEASGHRGNLASQKYRRR